MGQETPYIAINDNEIRIITRPEKALSKNENCRFKSDHRIGADLYNQLRKQNSNLSNAVLTKQNEYVIMFL